MARNALLLLLSGAVLALGIPAVHAEPDCTNGDRTSLAGAGYSKTEIESMCSSQAIPAASTPWTILSQGGQVRWIQWCVTPQGRCTINPMYLLNEPGDPCTCFMPWGFYGGITE